MEISPKAATLLNHITELAYIGQWEKAQSQTKLLRAKPREAAKLIINHFQNNQNPTHKDKETTELAQLYINHINN